MPALDLSVAPSWQQALKQAYRDPHDLLRDLELPADLLPEAQRAAEQFGLFATREYVARMRRGDVHDPLLRQVLPLQEELRSVPGFAADPVDDAAAMLTPGVLQKYQGRMLLVTTGACAVHCRYCFRRHFPYSGVPHAASDWEPALRTLHADESVREVILSGGDPWTLRDEALSQLAERLAAVPHLKRLRVHTRLPVILPQRVNDDLLNWLTGTRLVPWVVVHANHPQELDAGTEAALSRLVEAGVPVLNQAVLLRGVNDSAATLAELCERLVDLRVTPYYLHQLDRVAGAAHFEVPVDQGRQIISELRKRLPGYALPRYVTEIPGAVSKVELNE